MIDQPAALAITSIDITRMHGIREPFSLTDLCPGINLVHGPNAIGKSRTAAAIQALIWPDTCSRAAEIRGDLRAFGEEWSIDVESGVTRYQRNGAPATVSPFGSIPSSLGNRYLLTLQDLLLVNNQDFALAIQREMAGGYDLEAVRDEAEIKPELRFTQPTRWRNELVDASTRVRGLRRDDRALLARERSLVDANTQREDADAAATRVHELEKVLEHFDARERLQAAMIARQAFEEPIGSMSGAEYERLSILQRELDEHIQKQSRIDHEIDRIYAELTSNGFAQEIPAEDVVRNLRGRLGRLEQVEADLSRDRRSINEIRALLDSFRVRIGEALSARQIEELNGDGLRELSRLTYAWQQASLGEERIAGLQEWLGQSQPRDLERYRQGVSLLARFLRTPGAGSRQDDDTRVRWLLIGAAIIIMLEAILLGISLSPLMLLLVLLAVPLLWFSSRKMATDADIDLRGMQREYDHLGLATLTSWTPDDVERAWADLHAAIATAVVENEKASRWANLAEKRAAAINDLRKVHEQRELVFARYGVELREEGPECVRLIATAVDEWQRENGALTRALAWKATLVVERDMLLAAINDVLVAHGGATAVDAIAAAVGVEALAGRVARARQLHVDYAHARRRRDQDIEPRVRDLQQKVEQMFARAGLEHGDGQSLRRLCERVGPCREAQRAVEAAQVEVRSTKERLGSLDDAERSRGEIDNEMARAFSLASMRDEILSRINTIDMELRQAKQETKLEEAIVDEARALDILADRLELDYRHASGWHLLDFVQQRQRDLNRPEVFRVAEHLFTSFTSGEYRLELNGENPPEFVARQTATHRILGLDQLSSGTRVQLLLAVRLAFIEVTEQGMPLPLILDETLGNTDDVRAAAIIAAIIRIAQSGRQVIYFTAQHDEISKWHACIAASIDAPPMKTFDLARIRGQAGARVTSGFSLATEIFSFPELPDNVTYEDFRDICHVPPVNVWAESGDEIDLWYLIPDVSVLIKLRRRHITRWGQFLSLHHVRHLNGIWTEQIHECAQARVRVIEAVCRDWRHGRAKPLTRECLRECDLITDVFWEKVIDCAAEHEWDGASLIKALRDKAVSNFRTATIDECEEWFRERGYIVDAQILPDEMIRARAISAAADWIEQEIINVHTVDFLLKSMIGDMMLAQ